MTMTGRSRDSLRARAGSRSRQVGPDQIERWYRPTDGNGNGAGTKRGGGLETEEGIPRL